MRVMEARFDLQFEFYIHICKRTRTTIIYLSYHKHIVSTAHSPPLHQSHIEIIITSGCSWGVIAGRFVTFRVVAFADFLVLTLWVVRVELCLVLDRHVHQVHVSVDGALFCCIYHIKISFSSSRKSMIISRLVYFIVYFYWHYFKWISCFISTSTNNMAKDNILFKKIFQIYLNRMFWRFCIY